VECLFHGNFDAADAEALQRAVEEGIWGESQRLLDEKAARDSRAKVGVSKRRITATTTATTCHTIYADTTTTNTSTTTTNSIGT